MGCVRFQHIWSLIIGKGRSLLPPAYEFWYYIPLPECILSRVLLTSILARSKVCGLNGMNHHFNSGRGRQNATEKERISFSCGSHAARQPNLSKPTHRREINEDVLDLAAVQSTFTCWSLPFCPGLGIWSEE